MKINVGDVVELHELTVTSVSCGYVRAKCNGDDSITIRLAAVKSVKPPPLKVGDWVTWGTKSRDYEIVAIRGERAIMFNAEYGAFDAPLDILIRVENPT